MEMDMMCRRTLLGHKDDVISLSALGLRRRPPDPSAAAAPAALSPLASPRGLGIGASAGGSAPGAMLAALVASASADGSVRVWCAPNWTCLKVLVASPPLTRSPSSGLGHVPLLAAAAPPSAAGHAPSPAPATSGAAPPAAAAAAHTAAAPQHSSRPPLASGAAVAAAAALQRLPHSVAPVRVGHSSFSSFDFSGDDFSFGGSHASRAPAAPSPLGPLAPPSPAQQHVGFEVDRRPGGGPTGAHPEQQQHHHQHQHHHAAALGSPSGAGPPAALCVAVARGVISAGYVDGYVRLWHVEDLCGAAAEAVGRCLPSTPPPGVALEAALSLTGGYDLQTFLSHPGAAGLLGASPPASPRTAPGLLRDAASSAAAAAGLLASSGSGALALAAADNSGGGGAAGCACARVRAGSWAAAPGAASPPAHCAACSSMDLQLVRALKEMVAIRTVSSSQVRRLGVPSQTRTGWTRGQRNADAGRGGCPRQEGPLLLICCQTHASLGGDLPASDTRHRG
jgi:hypothetical protein